MMNYMHFTFLHRSSYLLTMQISETIVALLGIQFRTPNKKYNKQL